MDDAHFMRRALALAVRAGGNTSPNPMVGAVVVRDGQVVGEGFHRHAGAPHAERAALEQAGDRARGATLYVSMEPCAHHGRTSPCVEAIIGAGVARVVAAIADPDPQVDGRGFAALRAAGILVEIGAGEAQAQHINRAYVHHRRAGRPFVTLKMAQSLDGKIAGTPSERVQLTGNASAAFVRRLRIMHDAVMIGVGTVLIDDPLLTVRPYRVRHVPYVRVIVDARGRLPLESRVLKDQSHAKTLVATTEAMSASMREALERGAEVMLCRAGEDGEVDLEDLLGRLGARGTMSVLCEGGPTLAGSLLRARLVQELHWLIAPRVLASPSAVPVIAGAVPPDLVIGVWDVRRLGDDVLISASVT